MRRGSVTAFVPAVCAAFGLLAATALTAAAVAASPSSTAVIPDGVTVGGASIGGLAPADAREQLRTVFSRPLVLKVAGRKVEVTPQQLGAAAYLADAVHRARSALPFESLALRVKIDRAKVERYVRALAQDVERAPKDSRLLLRNLKPFVTKGAPGRRLDRAAATRALLVALRTNDREPLELTVDEVAPTLGPGAAGHVIVIRRGQNRLYFYDGTRLVRAFNVATGQTAYPTPLGRYEVVVKWKNPWWYPPSSSWAKGESPVPPGPGNPLGTRWMGLSAPLVGIHGTPNDASIGYSRSHGCIRMHIPDAEWLFERVDIGTAVYIVPQ